MVKNETSQFGLVGRAREIEELQRFVARGESVGGALLLTGEPGVGKTELLQAARAMCSTDTRVLGAAGVEFEADMPYAVLHQVLLPLHAEIQHLNDIHRAALEIALGFGVGDAPDRMLVSNAALSLLQVAASSVKLLLIIDDLQWVDRSSAIVLAFVARRLSGSRIGFVAAARTGEETMFNRAGLPELEIGPLDEQASRELLDLKFPYLPEQTRERLVTEADGNPLALVELPTMRDAAAEAAPLSRAPLPANRRIEQLFASRITALPNETKELLRVIALDGTGELRVPKQAGATKDWTATLQAAEQARLMFFDSTSHRLVFRHPLIRSTVVGLASGEELRRAHATLADLWAEQPERRAWHLSQATVEPHEAVAETLERAAHQILGRGDGVSAISTLIRAAELSPDETDRSRRLAEAAFVGADVTGDVRGAADLLAAAHRADPRFTNTLQAAATAAYVLINGDGDVDTAHRLLVSAIERADESSIGLEEALAALTLICFFGGRLELWEPFDAALQRLEPNVPEEIVFIKHCFADPLHAPPGVLAALELALARLETENDPTVVLKTAFAAGNVDRAALGRRAFLRLATAAQTSSAGGTAIQAITVVAFDDWWSGRWDDADRWIEEGLALCEQHGFPLFALSLQHASAAVAAARGEQLAAEATLEAMTRFAAPRGIGLTRFVCGHVRSIAALGRGDFEAAYRHSTAIGPPGTIPSHNLMASWVMMDVVESAVRTGRHDDARAHVAAMHACGAGRISTRLALLVAGASAMTAPTERAAELFEAALSIPDADRWPLSFARITLAFGEHLRRIRSTREARVHLGAAFDLFERLGARQFAERAAGELRATGQGQALTDSSERDALTPQELEIAQLAASGLSNKEIGQRLYLSHRTVSSHLYRIFPKLGITSRAALRDALESSAASVGDSRTR